MLAYHILRNQKSQCTFSTSNFLIIILIQSNWDMKTDLGNLMKLLALEFKHYCYV